MMAGVMVSISMATFWGYGENTATSQISMVEVLVEGGFSLTIVQQSDRAVMSLAGGQGGL